MAKKTPGKLNAPPSQAAFNKLPLKAWCTSVEGVFYRLHSLNRETGLPWAPVHFSARGTTRFDPVNGRGTLYIGETMAGVMMEIFDDRWGPVGDVTRSFTSAELTQWWVTMVAIPPSLLFEAGKSNLSKLGTDLQLVTGEHSLAREWALRLMQHPIEVGGILYPSRHDASRRNIALFRSSHLLPAQSDPSLSWPLANAGVRAQASGGPIRYGPPILLRDHPELAAALWELEVAILP